MEVARAGWKRSARQSPEARLLRRRFCLIILFHHGGVQPECRAARLTEPAHRGHRGNRRAAISRRSQLRPDNIIATRPRPAEVSKPQSVPASTRRRIAHRARHTLDPVGHDLRMLDEIGQRCRCTPATRTWSSASGMLLEERYSCAWRGLAKGSTKPPTLACARPAGYPPAARRSHAGPRSCPSRHAAARGRAGCRRWRG